MAKLSYIDAHTHIHFPEFDDDRDVTIERARNAGVGMITSGTDIILTKKAIEVAGSNDNIWATAGIHPHEAKVISKAMCPSVVQELAELAKDEKVVGIGECGIDLFREDDRKLIDVQKRLFIEQLKLAHNIKKPLIIHSRGSKNGSVNGLEMILDILEEHSALLCHEAGICHFFTGTKMIADRFIALGFSFTFGGLITFNREFDEVIRHIPAEKIMAETDAPFVAPLSHRGERNEPSYLPETVEWIARIRGVNSEDMRKQLLSNTRRVFGI